MKILEKGHIYELEFLDIKGKEIPKCPANHLSFVNREAGIEHMGTQTQDVIRALIDRTMHCDSCLRWPGNDKIIYHLRMALALHESRAIERKTEKGIIFPEQISISDDGHFKLG